MNTTRTPKTTPESASAAALNRRLKALDNSVGSLRTTIEDNAADQATVNTELGNKIAEMRSVTDQLVGELEAIRANPNLSAPEKHRKHTKLARTIKEMLDRLTALEARDASAPGYADAVNAELARMNEILNQMNIRLTRVESLEPRVDILDTTVMDHSATLEQHTEQISLATRASAHAVALAAAGGRGEPRWVAGFFIGIVAGVIAWLVARNWADLSTNYSWFAAIVVGVAVMLVVASFERQPEQATTAASSAAASASTPAPPPAPAVVVPVPTPAPAVVDTAGTQPPTATAPVPVVNGRTHAAASAAAVAATPV